LSLLAGDSRQAIPTIEWLVIASRAAGENLRTIARDYDVSSGAIRAILVNAGHAALLGDHERARRLAASAPLPPPAPRKVERERYGEVAELCRHHTQAEVAEQFGVSQATVWRIVRQVKKQTGIANPHSEPT
jgi:DNA invertase Pin-like site-specific DNA recombinase